LKLLNIVLRDSNLDLNRRAITNFLRKEQSMLPVLQEINIYHIDQYDVVNFKLREK
jgi:hypothetical protein